jgi:hypothetical protein
MGGAEANHENGPPPDWATKYISSYASTHPWEDWAETWAHYLHVVDASAQRSVSASCQDLKPRPNRSRNDLYDPDDPDETLSLLNGWIELMMVLLSWLAA